MKKVSLLEILENSAVKRHSFQKHEADIFTLVVELTCRKNEFSIEYENEESVTSLGIETDSSDLDLNQLARLQKDGQNIHLDLKNPGIYYFNLDLSDNSNPMLRIQAEHLEQTEHEHPHNEETGLEHFLNSKLPVTFEIGKTEMLIHDVLSLSSSSVIELDRKVGEPLDVYVGEELVAKGEVVVLPDGIFAARVIKVLPITGEMETALNLEAGVE